MTATELLMEFHRQGVTVEVAGADLRYRARPGVMTPDLRAELVQHKAEVVALLAPKSAGDRGTPSLLALTSAATTERHTGASTDQYTAFWQRIADIRAAWTELPDRIMAFSEAWAEELAVNPAYPEPPPMGPSEVDRVVERTLTPKKGEIHWETSLLPLPVW